MCGGREALAQTPPATHVDALSARLLTAIRQIPIIDNNAHPALPGDREMNALTFDFPNAAIQESVSLPLRLRSTNLEFIPAFRTLYGYAHTDLSLEHLRELAALKKKARTPTGMAYFNSVLDKSGIGVS